MSVMTEEEWKDLSDILGSFWGEIVDRTGYGNSYGDDVGKFLMVAAGVPSFTMILEARQDNPPSEEKIEALRGIMHSVIDFTIKRMQETIAKEAEEREAGDAVKEFLMTVLKKGKS